MRVLFFACALAAAWVPVVAQPESTTILPDGTYRYSIEQSGAVVGNSTIVVRRSSGSLTIGESGDKPQETVLSHRTLDPASFLTSAYSADINGSHLDVAIAGTNATITVGKVSRKLSATPGTAFVVSENLIAGFAQIPATLARQKQISLACICGGFIAIPAIVAKSATPVPPGLPSADVAITISLASVNAVLWYDPHSLVLDRLEVPAQSFVVSLVSRSGTVEPLPPAAAATPVPLPSPHYTSRDVTFAADDGVTLAGTLTVPDEAAKPMPGFVLVHGSGCHDRDETIGPNREFEQIANNLSNNGYAVLRYDKRSCGKSGGTFPVRDRLIADARDAIAYLRAQPGINSARIYVLGHSEGGELAPSIAIADGKLSGIILMAPPALPLEKIVMQQVLRQVAPTDRAKTQQAENAALKEIADGKKTDPYSEWLRSSFGIDPAAIIAKVPCPILILQGTKDIQVLSSDTPRLADAARATGRNVTVIVLPGDDHLFINVPGDQPSTIAEYFKPSYLDPALFTAIDTWLSKRSN